MAIPKNDLAQASSIAQLTSSDTVFVEVGGSIRRIPVLNFMEQIGSGNLAVSQYAWGIPLKQEVQTATDWGVIGNTALRDEWLASGGRYLVTNDGKAAKISRTGAKDADGNWLYEDGTVLDQTKGHIMVIYPDLYFLVQEGTSYPTLWCSPLPIGGHKIPHPCYGAFFASVNSAGALTSQYGATVKYTTTLASAWTLAQLNGKDWGCADYNYHKLVNILNLSIFGDTNAQNNVGYGIGGNGGTGDKQSLTRSHLTGDTMSLGDTNGKIELTDFTNSDGTIYTTNSCQVNLAGIEGAWNWFICPLQGIYKGSSNNDGQTGQEYFIYEGNRIPTATELAAEPLGDFRKVENGLRVDSGGYANMFLGEYFDLIGKSSHGSTSTVWCDVWYANLTGQLFGVGGHSDGGLAAGPAYVHANRPFSAADYYRAPRLAYYGALEIVNGSEIG